MKRKLILTGMSFLMIIGVISAQICPTPNSRSYNQGFNNYNNSNFNSVNNFTGINSLTYSFNATIRQGYRGGNLTINEVRRLENEFRRLQREIRFATIDGRISFFERNNISTYLRRLERSIEKEWYDNDTRLS